MRTFFKRFGPAILGSAGTQIALFADTIIASFLAAGSLSALYYADRLNQLPIGVIGIAVGTVLLPEMANRIAGGDERGAHHAQNRAIELTLLLSIPCVVAFLLVPDLIMQALFGRGAFTAADARASAATLAAYAIGLFPFVLMRSVTVTFLARGDTLTPVKALAVGVVVNVALKVALMGDYAQVGLAFATSIGAWINFGLLIWFAARQDLLVIDDRLKAAAGKLAIAGHCARGRAVLRRAHHPRLVCRLADAARRDHAGVAREPRRGGLFRHRARAVRPAVARSPETPRQAAATGRAGRRLIEAGLLSSLVPAEAGTQCHKYRMLCSGSPLPRGRAEMERVTSKRDTR